MGIAQHHDAVSGTAKQHVDFDYSKRLSIGQFNSLDTMSEILGKLVRSLLSIQSTALLLHQI
jgi:hypothetical protein